MVKAYMETRVILMAHLIAYIGSSRWQLWKTEVLLTAYSDSLDRVLILMAKAYTKTLLRDESPSDGSFW